MNICRFADFEVNLATGELRKHGIRLRLQDQPFQVLALLLRRAGKLVTREEIREQLWPSGTFVDFDNGLNAAISRLREALSDSAEAPKYVETLARRGYRWIFPVDWIDSAPAKASPSPAAIEASGSASLVGKKVSHYRIMSLLGAGGMGVVYGAEDIKLNRRVALKFLPDELARDSDAMGRFEREARAASALEHPAICSIYEFGEHEGQSFLVMPLLNGQSLRERLELEPKQPLEVAVLLDFAVQIAEGLKAAYEKNVIHRDIKPANIFVTSRGEIKILDFGLAKIMGPPEAFDVDATLAPGRTDQNTASMPDGFDLSLTKTGMKLGTALYMSPEQVRGEKVDSRTDIFSFGVVLYEMATGQRAFGANDGDLENAILHDNPAGIRTKNPTIPAQLEAIIFKAMQKDRTTRYQHIGEMCAELKELKWQITTARRSGELQILAKNGVSARTKNLAWLFAAVLLLVGSVAAISRFATHKAPLISEPKLRQLTANTPENPILGGTISPDGKYLVYTDASSKIRVKIIGTDEILAVPDPQLPWRAAVRWEIGPWFPDGTRFLVTAHADSAHPDEPKSAIWVVPLGGTPRLLRENSVAFAISPDNSTIAFGANANQLGLQEIWLMDASGQGARKLYEAPTAGALDGVYWAGSGQRILYFVLTPPRAALVTRDLEGGPPTEVLSFSNPDDLREYLWTGDGRLFYLKRNESKSAFEGWLLPIDPLSGKPKAKPQLIPGWPDETFNLSATADGKTIAFTRRQISESVYVSEVEAKHSRLSGTRRLTLTEYQNEVTAWTADGKSIIFESERNGHKRLFKQALDSMIEEPLFPLAAQNVGGAAVSPDGRFLFYLAGGGQLMCRPIEGGTPQAVLVIRPHKTMGWMPRCSIAPASLCVIAEQSDDGQPIVFTAFDRINGRGRILTTFETHLGVVYNFALSPDGTRLAIVEGGLAKIQLIYLDNRPSTVVNVKGFDHLQRIYWAADANGWFTSANSENAWTLLYVDSQGNANHLWTPPERGALAYGIPSPDGRHLAIVSYALSNNFWMLQN